MPHSKTYSVTVVVPIYNVENYIERCAVSLFEQDFDDIEYIFVDDASTDNSVAILKTVIERYPQRADHVRIIHNAENLGLFETRKVGVMAANGEYIQHIDSDDWVEKEMVSTMHAAAKAEDADVVACDFYIHNVDGTQYQAETHPKSRDDRLTALFATEIKANVWSRLVKREMYLAVYQALNLSKYHNMGEDKLLVMPLYCLVNTISYVPRGFYHYERRNTSSLTAKNSAKSYQEVQFLFTFLSQFLQGRITSKQMNLFKYRMCLHLLSLSDILGEKPHWALFRPYHFSLLGLWRVSRMPLRQKMIGSLYFLRLPWIVRLLKKLKRVIKKSLIR